MDLEITPNRPDCLSVIGLAREVATLYGSKLKIPATNLTHTDKKVEELAKVTLEDTEGCPRYTAQVLHDIEIGPAPEWMQQRLTHAGIRPINNVVDITNYVLLETGHPLHAFDQTLLKDSHIIIRKAKKGEKMTTLDEISEVFESISLHSDGESGDLQKLAVEDGVRCVEQIRKWGEEIALTLNKS